MHFDTRMPETARPVQFPQPDPRMYHIERQADFAATGSCTEQDDLADRREASKGRPN